MAGLPITRFCDERSLAVRQRLELFTQSCHAVQHAHQKGVIHRDLKPSNILVTEHSDLPLSKVIDFGSFGQANDEQNQNVPGVPDSTATIVLVAAALAGLAALRRRRR